MLTVSPTDGIGGSIHTLHISPRLLIFIIELRMIRLKRELWTALWSIVELRHAGAFGTFQLHERLIRDRLIRHHFLVKKLTAASCLELLIELCLVL